jgi:hypothetical protein
MVPEESPAWNDLHENAKLLRAITKAEDDVRSGRERSSQEAREHFEKKWAERGTKFA